MKPFFRAKIRTGRQVHRLLIGGLLCGCASVFHGPMDEEGTSFSATNYIEPRSLSADVSLNLLEIDPNTLKTNPQIASRAVAGETRLLASDPHSAGTEHAQMLPPITVVPPKNAKLIKHTVTKQDTLMKIAFRYTGNVYKWKEIYHLNRSKIKDFNKLEAKTILDIYATRTRAPRPEGNPYHIIWGDSLVRISNKIYGSTLRWKSLWHHNRMLIRNPNKIFAGFNMYYRGEKSLGERPIFRLPASSHSPETSLPIPLKISPEQSG